MSIPVPAPAWQITYDRTDVTIALSPFVLSITVTDPLKDASAEVDINLEDRDGRWANAWFPQQADRLKISIGYAGGPLVNYGAYKIDEIELNGTPDTVSMKAMAASTETDKRTAITKAWEGKSFEEIAAAIAGDHELELVGEVADAKKNKKWDRITQNEETDLAFLKRLGDGLGVVFAIKDEQLVWQDRDKLDEAKSITVIHRTDCTSYTFRAKTSVTYKACQVSYHDPKAKKTISHTEKAEGMPSGDTLKLRERCESKADAVNKAKAGLREANGKQVEGTVTIPGNPLLRAGCNVELAGWGVIDGDKYQVLKATHTMERGRGSATCLELSTATAHNKSLKNLRNNKRMVKQ